MRKVPQQERSRRMVERLVAAARVVLVRDGYESFTTNRVADEAGVSPGSLYQYFPDKTALVDTVIERWSSKLAERVAASLTERVDLTGQEMVRATADSLITALESDRALLRIFWEELPASRHRVQQRALEQRVREVLGAYLAAHGMPLRDAASAAWILVMATENIATRWVLDTPDITRTHLLDQFTNLTQAIFRPA